MPEMKAMEFTDKLNLQPVTRSKAIPGHEFSGIVAGLAILADEKCR
jgi:threonine dehydrogenase-like Zn-dependent dehydrogenase